MSAIFTRLFILFKKNCCINYIFLFQSFRGLTDESEILKFLQHGTLVGLLPVPHPILIRKYQANSGTTAWFRTYMWGVIYLRYVSSLEKRSLIKVLTSFNLIYHFSFILNLQKC